MSSERLKGSFLAKTLATLVFVIMGLALAGSIAGIVAAAEYNIYFDNGRSARSTVFDGLTGTKAYWLYEYYFGTDEDDAYYSYVEEMTDGLFSSKTTNMGFIITDSGDNVLTKNFSVSDWQYSAEYVYQVDADNPLLGGRYEGESEVDVTITCFVKTTFNAADEFESTISLVNLGVSMRYLFIAIAVLSLLFVALAYVFLLCAAGYRKKHPEPVMTGFHKIPLEIVLAAVFFIGALPTALYDWANSGNWIITALSVCLCGIVWLNLFVTLSTTIAVRSKCGRFWKSTLSYIILHFLYRFGRWGWSGAKYLFSHLPLVWQTALLLTGLSLAEFVVIVICISSYEADMLVFWWFIEKIVLFPVAILYSIFLRKLQAGGERLASGDMTYQVSGRHMPRALKNHADNLNSISVGISKAVDERMRSERFKAELITNVSHDIKTPLTSIVNYVNLLKREGNTPEQMAEYLGVLDRQSSRLKKLTEDLVEASKAASGSIQVNLLKTEAGILLSQTVGEYEERMRGNRLDLILTKPETPTYILCDGKLLWRVFDNLLNNICKYAQESTRVYLSLETAGDEVYIVFRNISKYELNISSEELLERFTRGDRSRNTEGSGLGLSIAKNLTELQNGRFVLSVDGDLFKVTLAFKRAE